MSLLLVNISDIHLSKNDNTLKEKLLNVAKACYSLITNSTTIVFVLSGDIVYSGTAEQYNIFLTYFNETLKCITNEYDVNIHTVCVPGNHDCFFTESEKKESGSVRHLIIKSMNPQIISDISSEYISNLLSSQKDFQTFQSNFDYEPINELVNVFSLKTSTLNLKFILLNTAWISQYHEKPGELFFPITKLREALNDIDFSSKPFVITVYHHPSYWFHPDNKCEFDKIIRNISDFILFGHEHHEEYITMSSDNWTVTEFEASAFYDAKTDTSAFKIFKFDNSFEKVTKIEYLWENNLFIRSSETTIKLEDNREISCTYPNQTTISWLNDLELPLPHYKLTEPISLQMIYCWPELEHLYYGTEDEKKVSETEKIKTDIFETITQSGLNIIVGDTYSGKTSMAKMIYKTSGKHNKCCLYTNGTTFSSYKEEKNNQVIEDKYIEQYNDETLEYFRQLSKNKKILIIDNFLETTLNNNKFGMLLNYLNSKFSTVVLFLNSTLEISMIMSQFSEVNTSQVVRTYKILPMGNVKRNEIISKWYNLGEDYSQISEDTSVKVDKATRIINQILSSQRAVIPAYPIYMLYWLQTIDSGTNDSTHINNYVFFYSTMIKFNLMKVVPNTSTQSHINILENVLSIIAYKMISDISIPLSYSECEAIISNFAILKQVAIDAKKTIFLLQNANIILLDNNSNIRFKYPYMYYYFAGYYIQKNYAKKEIKTLVQFMSQNLHNEIYGNTMIFVCSLSINDSIIDDILINALSLFETIPVYTFDSTPEIMKIAESRIKTLYSNNIIVGTENDVEPAQKAQREFADDNNICDGQVQENYEQQQNDNDSKYFKDFYAAQKIISVLGQIIRNYPGDIDGQRKEEIIRELHNLGMRLVNLSHQVLSHSLDGLLKFIEERIKASSNTEHIKSQKLVDNMTTLFALILLDFTNCVLLLEATSFGDNNSLITGEKVLSDEISGQLVLMNIKTNVLKTLAVDDIITYSKFLHENNYEFAFLELKTMVINYLKFNKCGTDERNRLCTHFNLRKDKILIEEQRNFDAIIID